MEHKVASPADFRNRIKDEDCYEAPEYVIFPKCGLEVLLRRPRPLAYTLLGAPLPGIASEDEAAPEESAPQDDAEKRAEIVQAANFAALLWQKVFVQPKLSLSPGFDAIHPDWIPKEDQEFVWRWIRGEVNNSGDSLSTFPGGV